MHTSGKYKLNILYTIPEANAGSTFDIIFNSKSISGIITEPFDPPLLPSPDRVKRNGESYEKVFKTKFVGSWELEKGKGQIKLQAKQLKGNRFADIRAIELILIK